MAVVLNHPINGQAATSIDPDYVVFSPDSEISISGPDDTITPVNDSGVYIELATAARQDTANASLATIEAATDVNRSTRASENTLTAVDGKIAGTNTRLDSIDSRLNSISSRIDIIELKVATEAKQDTGNASLAAIDTSLDVNLSTRLAEGTFTARVNTLGQKVSASSTPVVIASDQSVIPVSDNGSSLTVDAVDLDIRNLSHTQDSIGIKYIDSHNIDAFGRLRVSDPVSIFESTFQYDIQSLLWSSSTSGTGAVAHNTNRASVQFDVGTASGASAIYQTRQYFRYHPGKSQFYAITGNLGGVQANCRKRVGQFDSSNGTFFEADGTTLYVVIRSSVSGSVVDTRVAQSSWNLDPLNGTGVSGVTIDPTLQQILFVDYQWLGSGRVRFGTVINGQLIYAHQFVFANNITTPYSQTGSLPLRIELTNTGVTSASTTTYLTCATIYSEGGFAYEGISRTINRGTSYKTSSSGKTPLISLRKGSTGLNIPVKINTVSTYLSTPDEVLITFTLNPALTAASWAAATGGFCEVDLAATSMTGGTEIYSYYSSIESATEKSVEKFFETANTILGANLAGTSDIITVSFTPLTGSANVLGSINYREIY